MFDCVPKTSLLPVKKNEANYLISHNFINVFIDIKLTLCYKVATE